MVKSVARTIKIINFAASCMRTFPIRVEFGARLEPKQVFHLLRSLCIECSMSIVKVEEKGEGEVKRMDVMRRRNEDAYRI